MARSLFPSDSAVPSQEKGEKWIFVDAPDHDDVVVDSDKCGKWMLFHDSVELTSWKKITSHDRAWTYVKRLVETTNSDKSGIFSAKCSTAWPGHYETDDPSTGVICCYISDYNDKKLAKKASDSIRKAFYYKKYMFFKTDNDTRAMKYGHLGGRYISIYKHTESNEMFERDSAEPNKWIPVII